MPLLELAVFCCFFKKQMWTTPRLVLVHMCNHKWGFWGLWFTRSELGGYVSRVDGLASLNLRRGTTLGLAGRGESPQGKELSAVVAFTRAHRHRKLQKTGVLHKRLICNSVCTQLLIYSLIVKLIFGTVCTLCVHYCVFVPHWSK